MEVEHNLILTRAPESDGDVAAVLHELARDAALCATTPKNATAIIGFVGKLRDCIDEFYAGDRYEPALDMTYIAGRVTMPHVVGPLNEMQWFVNIYLSRVRVEILQSVPRAGFDHRARVAVGGFVGALQSRSREIWRGPGVN